MLHCNEQNSQQKFNFSFLLFTNRTKNPIRFTPPLVTQRKKRTVFRVPLRRAIDSDGKKDLGKSLGTAKFRLSIIIRPSKFGIIVVKSLDIALELLRT
ncbi:hypothetical protein AAHA92_04979 [Salvia divinorum]|uniref:Uncharacterized protein n=1 Tax=Salvia divinorum TaxID=28513 RepID=A0ABD1I0Z8_SALDI